MNVTVNGMTETDSKQRMTPFHCQYYSFSKQSLSKSTARDVHALQLVMLFVCILVYNKSTAVTGKFVVVTEQHGFRANGTFCVQ